MLCYDKDVFFSVLLFYCLCKDNCFLVISLTLKFYVYFFQQRMLGIFVR